MPGIPAWHRFEIVSDVPQGLTMPDEYKYFTMSDRRDITVGASKQQHILNAATQTESGRPMDHHT